MAEEIRHFTATIPPGTPRAAPVAVAITMPPRVVRSIYWRVPNGPMGVFGWQLAMGGVILFPIGSDLFVVANDEHGTWTPTGAPDSGAWQVIGFNTGASPHSVFLAFEVDFPVKPPQLRSLIAPHELSSSPDLSKAGPPVGTRP